MNQVNTTSMNTSTLVLAPISENEREKLEILQKELVCGSIYVLYKDNNGAIKIGIPEMARFFPETANMDGFQESNEKAFFFSGPTKFEDISDRPVYKIIADNMKKVIDYEIINDKNIELNDILNGNYVINNDSNETSVSRI